MRPPRRPATQLATICFAATLIAFLAWGGAAAETAGCDVLNGTFDQSESFWANEDEGPGLGSGIAEIVDVDGHTNVLHMDSRAGGNYYMFRAQSIDVGDCGGILGGSLSWQWELDPVESPFGLAAIWAELYDASDARLGVVLVRRHTGEFGPYDCASVEPDFVDAWPGQLITCLDQTGTSFDWLGDSIVFTQGLFDGMYPTAMDPGDVASLRIRIMSYNNAGTGVNAYFDDFQLETPPLAVAPSTWGRVKSAYR